ncbi:MAG: hypothetical protein JNL28_02780 [Planctomycetes bacterium]|nr:hypothetical protein [Planctomycetota bacterium]
MRHAQGAAAGAHDQPSILIGPGERLRPLAAVLFRITPAADTLDDLGELASRSPSEDIELVLDADLLPIEDLGYLRRFLAEDGRTRLALVGDDSGTRVVRTLLALPRARWMPWPPVLDDLIEMSALEIEPAPQRTVAPPHTTRSVRGPAAPRRPLARAEESDDEVDEIDALLESDSTTTARATRPAAVARDVSEPLEPDFSIEVDVASDFEPAESAMDSSEFSVSPAESDAPPPWWRAQIADLADTAQRVELGVQALRMIDPDSDEEVREHVDLLDAEVARLVQFARTLGYVAAPPARGDQVFDLSDTVQVFVSQLAGRPDATPRCQFRSNEPVFVRSDRALLGQALDAFFWLAGACSNKGDLVRAQVLRAGGPAEIRVEFPVGPLERVETARILEPYGLRRVLPDLGPNALSAAISIIVGQGGSAELSRPNAGRLAWRIVLPAVDPPHAKKKSK